MYMTVDVHDVMMLFSSLSEANPEKFKNKSSYRKVCYVHVCMSCDIDQHLRYDHLTNISFR